MNILILCHSAQQPPFNTMLRYHNWGKELVERGHRVTIVAASTVHNTDIDVIEEIGRDYAVVDVQSSTASAISISRRPAIRETASSGSRI